MALNQLGLGFLFTARDEASHVIHKLERSLGRLNTAQKENLKEALVPGALGAGGMLAGWAGLKGVFAISKEAGEFKQVLADVKVIAQATTEEMVKLREASYTSKFASPKESAQALLDLTQAGYNAQDSMKLLQPSLDMMAASLGDLSASASANLASQTMKAFGLEAEQADLVTDQLINTANDFALKARELPLLIGRASRGAISFGASLEETLVTVGLARNVMGGIEVAASGVSMAMERIIDPKHQKKLKAIGVEATNANGRFKEFSHLLLEMQNSPLYQKKTFAQQEAFILSVFGHRSLAAVQAFYKQVNSGITTKTGERLTGADAVDYLLNNARNAAGAKQRFIDAHFGDNLPGQMQLLRTSLTKLGTAAGEAFEPMFARIAARIRQGVDWILGAWMKLGPGTQAAIGKAALVVLGLVTAFGALVAAKASIVVLTSVLAFFGTTLTGLVVSMAPVAAGLLLFAGLAYLVYEAYKTNFGGLADFVDGAWKKVSLAVQGLVQAFTKGEFSGAVMDEIDKAENSGVKAFVIKLYMWGARIKNFFVGIGEGFMLMYGRLQPIFTGFLDALRSIGGAFGLTVGAADDNRNSFEAFGETGRVVGQVLADLAGAGLTLLTWALDGVSKAVNVCKGAWDSFGGSLGNSLQALVGVLQIVWGLLGDNGSTFWRGVINTSFAAIKSITNLVYSLVGAFAWAFDALAELGGFKTNWRDTVRTEQTKTNSALNESADFLKREADAAYWQPAQSGAAPSVAAAEAQRQSADKSNQSLSDVLMRGIQQAMRGGNPASSVIQVLLDGQVIAQAVSRANNADASQSYLTPAAETP